MLLRYSDELQQGTIDERITGLFDRIAVRVCSIVDPIVKCGEYIARLKAIAPGGCNRKPDPIETHENNRAVSTSPEHPTNRGLVHAVWNTCNDDIER